MMTKNDAKIRYSCPVPKCSWSREAPWDVTDLDDFNLVEVIAPMVDAARAHVQQDHPYGPEMWIMNRFRFEKVTD